MDRKCQKPDAVKAETARVGATRVRFRERQVLRASDLAAEQSYRLAARRRHNIGHHGWGIVSGLQLKVTPAGLVLEPGMAVDGYGRELFVHAPLALPPDAFEKLQSESLDVWLFYDITEATVPQRGNWDCGPGRNTRTREQSLLRLTAAREIDPRRPVEVPDEDLLFPPHETPPDSPSREWPVYLGKIKRTATAPPAYEIPPASSPYATLTGETVAAPSGRARMQVGSELESDARRFAVSVEDANGKLVERLAVDRDGNTVVTGNTTIDNRSGGNTPASCLRMRENKAASTGDETSSPEPLCQSFADSGAKKIPGAARMIHFLPLAATPAAAAPWQIYRTSVKQDDRTLKQLRVELKHPGDKGDPKLYRLTVGTRNANGVFKACFTVTADCTVTIEGAVNVNGQLIEGPIQADPSDPRFAAVITKQWATGVVAAESQLGTLFGDINSGELGVSITGLQSRHGSDPVQPVGGLTISPDDVLLYTFTVSNRGQSKVTDIQIYANLFFNDTRQSQEKLPPTPFDLDSDQERIILPGGVFDPRGVEGKIEIVVTAIGVGALPNVLAATDSATITVHKPPVIL